MSEKKDKHVENSRRSALKAITAASGTVVAAQWSRPVVDSVMLPAHARTSVIANVVGAGSGGSSNIQPPAP